MASTSRNIPLADDTTVVQPIQTPLNAMANALDAALGQLATDMEATQGYYAGTNAQRLALVAPKLRNGITWFATDTNAKWERRSGAWKECSPFAVAWGSTTVSATVNTITFPVGCFTVPPVVIITGIQSPNVIVPRLIAGSITAAQFQVDLWTMPGGARVAGIVNWQAAQATSAAAAS